MKENSDSQRQEVTFNVMLSQDKMRIKKIHESHVQRMRERLTLPVPDSKQIAEFLKHMKEFLFPLSVPTGDLSKISERSIYDLATLMSEPVTVALRHSKQFCDEEEAVRRQHAEGLCLNVLCTLDEIHAVLQSDIEAAIRGDPAARGKEDIILSYPGFDAILTYRIAHALQQAGVPLIPRCMTEIAHGKTGIDIHPGATIDEGFFIDHGTGVVIGETTVIGKNVRLYQGVTLGAGTDPVKAGQTKRHPTLGDNVVCFSGCAVLGPVLIGENVIIGAGAKVTTNIPANTLVRTPKIHLEHREMPV